jgi:hypothetical protein
MNTLTNQDYQKSIVAFVAGLLIGGLLVWVFSNPEAAEEKKMPVSDQGAAVVETVETSETAMVVGTGKVSVTAAAAGDVVGIAVAEYPAEAGWIAVRDYTDGVFGNVLGATRYSKEEGRFPTQVALKRATEAGKAYAVVFYSADTEFDLKAITMVEGVKAEFTAE